ncbi:hypothetical protein [Streptomyces sp. NPDC005805]|uniref:hypothetical protein n=1 Tax=Streptomyces sp. NPDC005805 TaxID=3157068 RepID=UPI0034090FEB
MRKAVLVGVATTAAVALVWGILIGAGRPDEQSGDRRAAVVAVAAPPLAAYLPTQRQNTELTEALSVVARSCMQRYGITTASVVSDAWILETAARPVPLYVPEAQARTSGYHEPSPGEADGVGSGAPADGGRGGPQSALSTEQRAVYETLMNGWAARPGSPRTYRGESVPRFGCLGEADAALMRGGPRPVGFDGKPADNSVDVLNITLELIDRADRMARNDSGYRSMVKEWSRCMAEAGHRYATPEAARDDGWFDRPAPTDRERDLAVQDTRCKDEVSYVAIVSALEQSTQRRMIERHRPLLDLVNGNIEARMKNAREIVRNG